MRALPPSRLSLSPLRASFADLRVRVLSVNTGRRESSAVGSLLGRTDVEGLSRPLLHPSADFKTGAPMRANRYRAPEFRDQRWRQRPNLTSAARRTTHGVPSTYNRARDHESRVVPEPRSTGPGRARHCDPPFKDGTVWSLVAARRLALGVTPN